MAICKDCTRNHIWESLAVLDCYFYVNLVKVRVVCEERTLTIVISYKQPGGLEHAGGRVLDAATPPSIFIAVALGSVVTHVSKGDELSSQWSPTKSFSTAPLLCCMANVKEKQAVL